MRYDAKSRQFVPYLSGISAEDVSFSRDGAWVAYLAYPEGTLWRSKVDGSERMQLTFLPLETVKPSWSPDGRRIAFAGRTLGKPSQIYLVSPEGRRPSATDNRRPQSLRGELVARWELAVLLRLALF